MTKLRKKMIEDMQLHGLSESTQKAYVYSVNNLAKYYNISPDKLTQDDIRKYFLYLVNKRKVARSTLTVHLCGIRFFFEKTLNKEWETFNLIKPKKRKKLPIILSIKEIKKILDKVQNPGYRMCLTMIYSCGLRVSEGVRLNVVDIDSKRMMVKICDSKNGKDRYIPLPIKTLKLLKEYWKVKRPYPWLFPSKVLKVVSIRCIQRVFQIALKESGIRKAVSIHSLRHSYATHLLENDVNIRVIQVILGHSSPQTTSVYTHLTNKITQNLNSTINNLIEQI